MFELQCDIEEFEADFSAIIAKVEAGAKIFEPLPDDILAYFTGERD